MGIRFFCDCGHRLNVKSFLAGKKGICPECGAKFVIPEESDPRAHANAQPATQPENGVVPQGLAAKATEKIAKKKTVVSVASQRPSWSDAELAVQSTEASAPIPAAATPPEVTNHDPIEMAGSAVWYVRHADGGQYGPAEASIMRLWLEEGRVAGDSMVWHQGWADWRRAGDVFAELPQVSVSEALPGGSLSESIPPSLGEADGSPSEEVQQDSSPAESMSFGPEDPSIALARQRDLRRKRSMMMLGGLVLIAIALAVVAVVILLR